LSEITNRRLSTSCPKALASSSKRKTDFLFEKSIQNLREPRNRNAVYLDFDGRIGI
jgi:hypothetical protein